MIIYGRCQIERFDNVYSWHSSFFCNSMPGWKIKMYHLQSALIFNNVIFYV